jgi:hypothetical protein
VIELPDDPATASVALVATVVFILVIVAAFVDPASSPSTSTLAILCAAVVVLAYIYSRKE